MSDKWLMMVVPFGVVLLLSALVPLAKKFEKKKKSARLFKNMSVGRHQDTVTFCLGSDLRDHPLPSSTMPWILGGSVGIVAAVFLVPLVSPGTNIFEAIFLQFHQQTVSLYCALALALGGPVTWYVAKKRSRLKALVQKTIGREVVVTPAGIRFSAIFAMGFWKVNKHIQDDGYLFLEWPKITSWHAIKRIVSDNEGGAWTLREYRILCDNRKITVDRKPLFHVEDLILAEVGRYTKVVREDFDTYDAAHDVA